MFTYHTYAFGAGSEFTDSGLPTTTEHPGGISAVHIEKVAAAFQDCAFTNNSRAFALAEGAIARVEGCTFLRNEDDVMINQSDDSAMYTDIPERNLTRGVYLDGSLYDGDILSLLNAPDAILELSSNDGKFVTLRKVRAFRQSYYLRRCMNAQ